MAKRELKSLSPDTIENTLIANRSPKRRKSNDGTSIVSAQTTRSKCGSMNDHCIKLIKIRKDANVLLSALTFTKPSHVYNPLEYAWKAHESYLRLITIPRNPLNETMSCEGKVMFLGMNPGCHGMVQSGVPFGDIEMVQNWMKITDDINVPPKCEQNPKKPIVGLSYHRKEISGRRLYFWAKSLFKDESALTFFSRCFVINYCTLCFMDNSRNLIPEKLSAENKVKLYKVCDGMLMKTIDLMKPKWIVGIGVFAEQRATKIKKILSDKKLHCDFKIIRILHPSPANPSARNFDKIATEQFKEVMDSLFTSA